MIARMCLQRILIGVLTLWVVGTVIFVVTELLPGDLASAILGQYATEESLAALREQLGLNRPFAERYADWLTGILTGDLGTSLATGYSAADVVASRLFNTVNLAIYTSAVAIPLSVFLGLLAAAYPSSLLDRVVSSVSVFSISIPSFVIGVILVLLVSIQLKVFPSVINRPNWNHLDDALFRTFLPMITLVFSILGYLTRMTRAAVIDVLRSPYVEMALLKGGGKWYVIFKHALPNALGPIVNVIALSLGYLISGVAIVEVVFSYPGIGRLLIDSIVLRDVTLVQACGVVFATIYIGLNIFSDILALLLNPRARYRA